MAEVVQNSTSVEVVAGNLHVEFFNVNVNNPGDVLTTHRKRILGVFTNSVMQATFVPNDLNGVVTFGLGAGDNITVVVMHR